MCCIYTPLSLHYDLTDLEGNIEQLPVPHMLLGDFNAHHTLRGDTRVDMNGKTIESILEKHDLCLFNDKSSTCIHPAKGTRSSLDLTICPPSLFLDNTWAAGDDQC